MIAPGKGRAAKAVSQKNKLALWTRAAGRCEYEGCNELLLGDLLSGKELLNKAFIAHIVAASPEGPRGHPTLSHELADELSNLMLLCHGHHRLADVEDEEGHSVERLTAMKAAHEARIALVTGIGADRSTTALLYAARIGAHDCLVSPDQAKVAVLPTRYPSETLSLELVNSELHEDDPAYWQFQLDHLRSQFDRKVGERLRIGQIRHLSVFAIAPQPLLIELGRLMSDIAEVDVYPLAREPRGWLWREDGDSISWRSGIEKRSEIGPVALALGVSATINSERIREVLGDNCTIWFLGADQPGNDILRRRQCLANFRAEARAVLANIRADHQLAQEIHVFPAMPVALSVELGRVWMPKADLPLVVYDENFHQGGFRRRMVVNGR